MAGKNMIADDRYGYILSMPFPEMVNELKKDRQEAMSFLIQYQLVSKYDRKKEILSTLCQALDIEINFIKSQAYIEKKLQNKENENTENKIVPSTEEQLKEEIVDHFVKTGKWIGPENNGGSTNYYKIKSEWKDLQDVIKDLRKI